jgi:hypothetical protein
VPDATRGGQPRNGSITCGAPGPWKAGAPERTDAAQPLSASSTICLSLAGVIDRSS